MPSVGLPRFMASVGLPRFMESVGLPMFMESVGLPVAAGQCLDGDGGCAVLGWPGG